jgi:hypothetical protein
MIQMPFPNGGVVPAAPSYSTIAAGPARGVKAVRDDYRTLVNSAAEGG